MTSYTGIKGAGESGKNICVRPSIGMNVCCSTYDDGVDLQYRLSAAERNTRTTNNYVRCLCTQEERFCQEFVSLALLESTLRK